MATPPGERREAHPVRLVVTDDLRRRRWTVLLRLVLALPHLVWITLFGLVAGVVAFVAWLAVLFDRRVPGTLHGLLASFVRYSVHLTAYLTLAAEPYPRFSGNQPYPVDVEIDPPVEQGRAGAAFRLLLVIPAFALASALAGSVAFGAAWGLAVLGLIGGLSLAAGFLGWFASLATRRMPRGLRDAAAYAIGYGAQTTAYALFVTGRYPDAIPGRAEPAPELPPHPVSLVVRDDLGRPRLLVFFRPLLVVPHLFWLSLWSVAVAAAAIVAWVAALATGRVPSVLHRFIAAFVRTTAHVTSFLYLVGRPFPGYVGREGGYPIDLTIAPPERQARLSVLARLVLVIPALLVAWAYANVLFVVAVLGWLVALVIGRMPGGIRDLGAASVRYQAQVNAYLLLLTARYPDSSPALVGRSEPELLVEP